MNKILLQIAVNAFAFFVAITLLNGSGINAQEMQWWGYVLLALIFGLINGLLKPVLALLGCPFILITFGLGILLINTLMFFLAGQVGLAWGFGFTVDGFWPAFFGALIVSLIGFLFNLLVGDGKRPSRRKKSK